MQLCKLNRALFFCAFVLILCVSAFAQNQRVVIPTDSEIYRYIDMLYIEQGIVQNNSSKPWDINEAEIIISKIDYEKLSESGKNLYEKTNSLLSKLQKNLFQEDKLGLCINFVASPEAFTRINFDSDSDTTKNSYSRIHGYEDKKALLDIPISMWYGNSFYLLFGATLKEEHAMDLDTNYFNIGFDDPVLAFDVHFPFRAYSTLGGKGWSFRFGRDKISIGNGQTGNLVMSDYSDYYDYIGFYLFNDKIKLTTVYSVMDNFYDPKTKTVSDDYEIMTFALHRLDISIFDNLSVAMTEAMAFGKMPDIIRDLNYTMLYHNFMLTKYANSIMSLEVNYSPWKFINLYGQFALDEFTTKYEAAIDGGNGPGVFGYIAGAKTAWPLSLGYLSANFEWAMTSPWLYNRTEKYGVPVYLYNIRRACTQSKNGGYTYIVKPIGYEYGPDAIVYNLKTTWDVPNKLKLTLDTSYIVKGETDITSSWQPKEGDSTPSGENPEQRFVVGLDVVYTLFKCLDLGGGTVFSYTKNALHTAGAYSTDMELYTFVKYSY